MNLDCSKANKDFTWKIRYRYIISVLEKKGNRPYLGLALSAVDRSISTELNGRSKNISKNIRQTIENFRVNILSQNIARLPFFP